MQILHIYMLLNFYATFRTRDSIIGTKNISQTDIIVIIDSNCFPFFLLLTTNR